MKAWEVKNEIVSVAPPRSKSQFSIRFLSCEMEKVYLFLLRLLLFHLLLPISLFAFFFCYSNVFVLFPNFPLTRFLLSFFCPFYVALFCLAYLARFQDVESCTRPRRALNFKWLLDATLINFQFCRLTISNCCRRCCFKLVTSPTANDVFCSSIRFGLFSPLAFPPLSINLWFSHFFITLFHFRIRIFESN